MKFCLNVLLVAVSIPIVAISAGKQVALAAAGDPDNAAADLQVIKKRLVEMVLAPPSPAREGGRSQDQRGRRADDPAAIERLMSSLRADGSWGDLQYGSATPKDLAHGS
jgi:hypothetical protein